MTTLSGGRMAVREREDFQGRRCTRSRALSCSLGSAVNQLCEGWARWPSCSGLYLYLCKTTGLNRCPLRVFQHRDATLLHCWPSLKGCFLLSTQDTVRGWAQTGQPGQGGDPPPSVALGLMWLDPSTCGSQRPPWVVTNGDPSLRVTQPLNIKSPLRNIKQKFLSFSIRISLFHFMIWGVPARSHLAHPSPNGTRSYEGILRAGFSPQMTAPPAPPPQGSRHWS